MCSSIGFHTTIIFLIVSQSTSVFAGSCREAQLCCNGRDSSCVVQKTPINAIIEDLSEKPCYCDHACLKLGDCCEDFKQHCGVLDCQISEWGPWSDCDTKCGTGMMSRTRTIEQAPQNGGKHCPSLMQKRGCQGYKCHGRKGKSVLREMALLLPAALSKNRHANDSSDIRRNLRLRYRDSFKHNREHEYCVEFEVIKATKSCFKLSPYNIMLEGDRISVRCDLEALVYDLSNKTNSNYNKNNHINNNVINNYNNKTDNTNNPSLPDEDEEDNEVSPRAFSPNSKYRCRGEGLPGRTTRWSALAAPSCRGKWIRLTVGEPKKCSQSEFIFV